MSTLLFLILYTRFTSNADLAYKTLSGLAVVTRWPDRLFAVDGVRGTALSNELLDRRTSSLSLGELSSKR